MNDENILCGRDKLYWTDLREFALLLPEGPAGDEIALQIGRRLPEAFMGQSKVTRHPLDLCAPCHLIFARRMTIIEKSMLDQIADDLVVEPLHDRFGPSRLDFGLRWRAESGNPSLGALLASVIDPPCRRAGAALVQRPGQRP